ncbi:MAG: hypothetical protein GF344_11850 [Chitinivibrionales bacterium]|nr:hypothetical protein [Chitinivibrionales bacterium]MBD3357479.1 hypothetical protein [Chitinivibrionales bacterium]
MNKERTISNGISLAIRRPETGAALLACTLTEQMNGAPWINKDIRMRFCIAYLRNCIDGHIEKSVDESLLRRLMSKPLTFGIRLLKRNPDAGIAMLVAMVMEELRERQKASPEELVEFGDEMLLRFFPEAKDLTTATSA